MVHGHQSQCTRRLSKSTYRTVFAQARDVCIALERGSGRITRCNDVVRTMLGFSPGEIVGHPISELAPPDSSEHARGVWHSLATDLEVPASDVEVLRKDGGRVDARLTGAGVHDDAGGVAFGVALLRARSKTSPEACPQADSPERLRAWLYALSVAEERERRRIAAGLHDDLGQLLAIAKLRVGRLGVATDTSEREALTNDLRDLIDQAARSARSTTFELSSPVLQQLGLDAALQSCGERMQQMYGFRFSFESDRTRIDLPHEALVVLLRVVRELLFNVHKHARASAVHVASRRAGALFTICTTDDGVGFCPADLHAFTPAGGFGLASAEAQVHAIGGRFAIESSSGAGTRVTISVPVPDTAMQA